MLDNHYRNNYGGRLYKPRNEAALYAIGRSEIAKTIVRKAGHIPEPIFNDEVRKLTGKYKQKGKGGEN